MHQFIPFLGLTDRRWVDAQVEAGGPVGPMQKFNPVHVATPQWWSLITRFLVT